MVHTIGLIVTGQNALKEYTMFVKTLEQWHPDAHLCVYTDSPTDPLVKAVPFKGKVTTKIALNAYTNMNRQEMEATRGIIYDNMFKDFCYEKANVMEWMFDTQDATNGFWFMDCDLTCLAPLPAIPDTARVALCPHYIRRADEKMYGKYNAGMLWMSDRSYLKVWRDNGHGSFLDQTALEEVAFVAQDTLYEFPIQVNFGWWRMFQSSAFPADIMAKFSIFRGDTSIGIRYDGRPLQSIHTHWHETESVTGAFNRWFNEFSNKFKTHKPIASYRRTIGLDVPIPKETAKQKK
jgi:hypothetical protein